MLTYYFTSFNFPNSLLEEGLVIKEVNMLPAIIALNKSF
jgi:hypothetical protein